MEEYQVIVVGAGPAGSACARALKDEGIEVLVIEKNSLPRHKTCSGVLMGQTQILLEKYFGSLPPDEVYCQPKVIKASNINEWNKEKGFFTYVWELPKDGQSFPQDFFNAWRNKFDYWLLKESGAEYKDNCTFRNFSVEDNRIKVEVSTKDKESTNLYCSYLVGADGGISRVRMLLEPAWAKEAMELAVYQGYFRFSDRGSLEKDNWYVFFEKDISDCLASIHNKDEFLTLCVGGFKGQSLKDRMEAFKRFLNETFQVVLKDMDRDEGTVMRLAPPFLGKDKVILTGEAAGFMYLNGEGISAAIDSGYRAGKVVSRGIKNGEEVMEIYPGETGDILNHLKICAENIHFLVS